MRTDYLNQASDPNQVLQYSAAMTILVFAWPAAWFTFSIYVLARPFVPDGGTMPTRMSLTIIVLGTGAELVAGLALLKREGYMLTYSALRDRIRLRWPRGLRARAIAGVVLVLGMGSSRAMGSVNRVLASVPGFVPPEWWPTAYYSHSSTSINVGYTPASWLVVWPMLMLPVL